MRKALAKRGNFSTTLSILCSKLEGNVDGFDINEIPLLRVSNESRVKYRTRCSLRKYYDIYTLPVISWRLNNSRRQNNVTYCSTILGDVLMAISGLLFHRPMLLSQIWPISHTSTYYSITCADPKIYLRGVRH